MKLQKFYQHNNKVLITEDNYLKVHNQKIKAIDSIHKIFEKHNIKYVIGHGNLIQYVRKKPIYHDDDVDIRICHDDVDKLYNYFDSLPKLNNIDTHRILKLSNGGKYDKDFDIYFDNRCNNKNNFLNNGIQAKFLDIKNPFNIFIDLVSSFTESKFWLNYDIDWLKIKKVKCYNIYFYVPSDEDTHKVLLTQYKNYLKPSRRHEIDIQVDF